MSAAGSQNCSSLAAPGCAGSLPLNAPRGPEAQRRDESPTSLCTSSLEAYQQYHNLAPEVEHWLGFRGLFYAFFSNKPISSHFSPPLPFTLPRVIYLMAPTPQRLALLGVGAFFMQFFLQLLGLFNFPPKIIFSVLSPHALTLPCVMLLLAPTPQRLALMGVGAFFLALNSFAICRRRCRIVR